MREKLKLMIEIALMAGLAFVLGMIKFSGLWAQGGSVSLIMLPIFLVSFRHGLKAGVLTGLLVGCLDLLGGYVVHPIQMLLDYPLAYMLVGLAGIFSWKKEKLDKISYGNIYKGVALGSLGRLISHFFSGVIWFGIYAPEGMPVVAYSLFYNLSYLVLEVIIVLIVLRNLPWKRLI